MILFPYTSQLCASWSNSTGFNKPEQRLLPQGHAIHLPGSRQWDSGGGVGVHSAPAGPSFCCSPSRPVTIAAQENWLRRRALHSKARIGRFRHLPPPHGSALEFSSNGFQCGGPFRTLCCLAELTMAATEPVWSGPMLPVWYARYPTGTSAELGGAGSHHGCGGPTHTLPCFQGPMLLSC